MMSNQALLERMFSGRRALLKRTILLDALQCFMEHGIENTTIEMIRQKSDSSVGAIYHHFKNKDGIVAALFFSAQDDLNQLRQQYLNEIEQDHSLDFKSIISAVIFSYADWVTQHPDFARFQFSAHFNVSHGAHQSELKQKSQDQIKILLSKIKKIDQDLPHYPTELYASLVIGPTENYCRAWLSNKVQTSPHEYRHFLAEAALKSLI
ncbi:TetR/AcrR family transcriptional regulator [Acinetobacter gerneri]|uniref:TetR/AcrR family transcriptional regulator n=1 Tax=Acinetobacter gerneri TaxID=202952 RepID=UPI0032139CB2